MRLTVYAGDKGSYMMMIHRLDSGSSSSLDLSNGGCCSSPYRLKYPHNGHFLSIGFIWNWGGSIHGLKGSNVGKMMDDWGGTNWVQDFGYYGAHLSNQSGLDTPG